MCSGAGAGKLLLTHNAGFMIARRSFIDVVAGPGSPASARTPAERSLRGDASRRRKLPGSPYDAAICTAGSSRFFGRPCATILDPSAKQDFWAEGALFLFVKAV